MHNIAFSKKSSRDALEIYFPFCYFYDEFNEIFL